MSLQSRKHLLEFTCTNSRERPPRDGWKIMFTLLTIAIFGGMIAMVIYEIIEETRGSKTKLLDRYHEET